MKAILKTLPNGVRVLVIPQLGAQTVTALILSSVGSKYERPAEAGISHFLEHMCFKGTEKRPSARTIAEELESIGAVSNAFTDHEYTGYYAKGNPTHIDTFIDVLSDMYLHSTFPEKEIQKEKGVVIEEINLYEDMPQHKVAELLFSTMYGGQSVGHSILGTKETVSHITQKSLRAYQRGKYTAANTVVVLAGHITAQKGMELARKAFGKMPKASRNKKKKVTDKQRDLAIAVAPKHTDQAHLVLGFRSLPMGHKDIPALRVLSTILGRGSSSRLFLRVREELGAAYYISARQDNLTDHGVFSIAAGIDKNRLPEILSAVIEECKRLKEELVPNNELMKAKEMLYGGLRLGLESSDDLALYYGAQVVLDQKIKSPDDLVGLFKRVTAKDVQRVARFVLQHQKATLALVGPFEDRAVSRELFMTL